MIGDFKPRMDANKRECQNWIRFEIANQASIDRTPAPFLGLRDVSKPLLFLLHKLGQFDSETGAFAKFTFKFDVAAEGLGKVLHDQ